MGKGWLGVQIASLEVQIAAAGARRAQQSMWHHGVLSSMAAHSCMQCMRVARCCGLCGAQRCLAHWLRGSPGLRNASYGAGQCPQEALMSSSHRGLLRTQAHIMCAVAPCTQQLQTCSTACCALFASAGCRHSRCGVPYVTRQHCRAHMHRLKEVPKDYVGCVDSVDPVFLQLNGGLSCDSQSKPLCPIQRRSTDRPRLPLPLLLMPRCVCCCISPWQAICGL
jgi:hypothetical protein